MDDTRSARDQRLLMFSIWASAGFAVLSSVWGILSGSSMIVFDGLYSFVSIGLSVLAVLALRFSRRKADERFPWGREAAEPLVVMIKAATLGALCRGRRDPRHRQWRPGGRGRFRCRLRSGGHARRSGGRAGAPAGQPGWLRPGPRRGRRVAG